MAVRDGYIAELYVLVTDSFCAFLLGEPKEIWDYVC